MLIPLLAMALVFLAACAQAGSTPTPSPVPSSPKALAPPILTEPQAVETASQIAARSRRGLTDVSNIRNRQTRLMTMGEYWALGQYDEGFFGSAEWYSESDLPVWVVLMEGNSESTLPTSLSLPPTRYNYFVVVLNAHTGYEIGVSPLSAPDPLLVEAPRLDPARYARYPLEAALEYTRDITEFPVSEPSSLPGAFSLARVTLELARPLQDVLAYPQERRQTVLQNYSDGEGNTIQLAQFRGGLPDLIEDADPAAVQKTRAWASREAGDSTWLVWTWVFPEAGAYVTYILYSEAPSISLDTLHEIAASMPGGRPPPAIPEPVRVPTALPRPTQPAVPREDCPITPYYVNPEPIPENEWRDAFAAGGKWFRSPDNHLWFAAQPGYWRAGRPNKGLWLKPWGSRLEVTGKELDGGGSLTPDIPDGYYGDFQASHLFFSSAGCWEVEAQAEDSHLRFVIYVGP